MPHSPTFLINHHFSPSPSPSFPLDSCMYMAQEEVDLALGLSFGSGTGHHHLLQPKEAPPLEPSLTLSLTIAVKRENVEEENERAMIYYPAASSAVDDDIEGCNNSSRSWKKLRLTKEQSALLEGRFKEHSTLDTKQKTALARQLNLRPRQVEVWFQNRRARTKLKQTEVDCELLKRCCETLTEENRRVHLELQQLRALNNHHPTAAFFMPAAAMLSVCPSCERLVPAQPAHAAAAPDRPAPKLSFFTTNSALLLDNSIHTKIYIHP